MIHTATLVHDDVLDEADVRRHASTVNAARTRALVAMIALGIAATLSVALLVESWSQSPARQRKRKTKKAPKM